MTENMNVWKSDKTLTLLWYFFDLKLKPVEIANFFSFPTEETVGTLYYLWPHDLLKGLFSKHKIDFLHVW